MSSLQIDVPECTRDGVLKKSWKYYRRTGAIWTDPYHMPVEQRRFSERPDLDAKYEEHLRKTKNQEDAKERKRKEEIKLRNKKIRTRLHLRQAENASKYGWPEIQHANEIEHKRAAKARATVESKMERRHTHVHKLKSHDFYRREGFLWSDMTHVPHDRLHLVLDHRIVEKDKLALELIDKRLEEENLRQFERAQSAQGRADEIRREFRAQLVANDRRATHIGLRCPQRTVMDIPPGHVKDQNRVVPRLLSRSQKGALVSDKSGLLHIDHAASQRLEHFRSMMSISTNQKQRPQSASEIRPRAHSMPGNAEESVLTSRRVMFASIASLASGDDSIGFGEEEGDQEIAAPSSARSSSASTVPACICVSLSDPEVVLQELDEFEARLEILEEEEKHKTGKPFWMM